MRSRLRRKEKTALDFPMAERDRAMAPSLGHRSEVAPFRGRAIAVAPVREVGEKLGALRPLRSSFIQHLLQLLSGRHAPPADRFRPLHRLLRPPRGALHQELGTFETEQ